MRAAWAGLTAVAVVLAGCSGDEPEAEPRAAGTLTACPDQPDEPAAGAELMPALELRCPGGGSLDLGQAPGVPTVVNLWASWCLPCRTELPILEEFTEVAGDEVRVVGVISKDTLSNGASFAEDAGVDFPNALDDEGALMTALGLNGLPFTYFLDAGGALVHTEVGEVRSVDELRGLVAEHLGVQL